MRSPSRSIGTGTTPPAGVAIFHTLSSEYAYCARRASAPCGRSRSLSLGTVIVTRADLLRRRSALGSTCTRSVARITVTLITCVLAACTGQTEPVVPEPKVPEPVVVVKTRSVWITRAVGDLRVGDTSRIQFVLIETPGSAGLMWDNVPLVAGRNRVEYRVADTAVATVSADGLVTARRVGSTSVGVTVDGQFTTSDGLDVVTPPQQLVLLASGDGDIDVAMVATCSDQPYGPTIGRYLPSDCRGSGICQVRGGVMTQACRIDVTRPRSGFIGIVRFAVKVDTTMTLQFLNPAGQVVPLGDAGAAGCPGAGTRCLVMDRRVVQPDTVTVSVARRRT